MLTFCILRLYIIILGHYNNENDWGTLGSPYSGSEEHPALFPGLPMISFWRIFFIRVIHEAYQFLTQKLKKRRSSGIPLLDTLTNKEDSDNTEDLGNDRPRTMSLYWINIGCLNKLVIHIIVGYHGPLSKILPKNTPWFRIEIRSIRSQCFVAKMFLNVYQLSFEKINL